MMEGLEGRSLMAATLPTTIKLGMSAESLKLGEPLALAARVGVVAPDTTTPTGRAAFYVNGNLIGSKKINSLGVARFTIPVIFSGAYTLKSVYLGDATHLGHRSGERSLTVKTPALTTSGTGLKKATVVAGTGNSVSNVGNTVTVDYTGYLGNGSIFDSSYSRGTTLQATIGITSLISGFTEGLIGMKLGETRLLVIPSNLGYGASPNGNIPANSTLIFVVTMRTIA